MPDIKKFKEPVTDTQISGFYYDEQLKDKYLTVSLHPNTVPGTDGWIKPSGNHLDAMVKGNTWSECYSEEPIAVSILNEDFQIEINNSWTDFDGGNAIESIWNSAKPYAPMLGKLGQGLSQAAESMDGSELGSGWVNTLTGIAKWAGDKLDIGSEYLNKALIVQGTRFSYYAGTSTTFGNLNMKYTIFSDWDKNGKFITVNDQLNKIYPYVMGTYDPVKGGILGDKIDKFLGEYIGWQNPPAGFEADTKNLDNCQKGTLRLVIGGYYSIENLVARNISINMSKVMAKHPQEEGLLTPLYADVTITLSPASSFTDRALARFTNGDGMEKIINDLKKENQERLKKTSNDMKPVLNTSGLKTPTRL